MFYAGRFANLFFGVMLVGAALALAPVGRRFFTMIALLPMSVHVFGSYAPEVGAIGAALLIPALVLRIALAERRAAWWEVALLLAAIAWIAASKPPYLPIAAFLLAIPAARFGGKFHRVAFLALAIAVGGSVGMAAVEATRTCYPDPHTHFGAEVSVEQQTEFVKHNPERFAVAFAEAAVVRGVPTYFRLFKLGWLDVTIDPATIALFTMVLLLMAMAGHEELVTKQNLPCWPAALVAFGGMVLIVLSLYLWSTPVGSPAVEGMHGRYLLPLLPTALFLVPAWVPRYLKPEGAQRRLAWWATGIMTAIAFAAVVSRYYLVKQPLLLNGSGHHRVGSGAGQCGAREASPRIQLPLADVLLDRPRQQVTHAQAVGDRAAKLAARNFNHRAGHQPQPDFLHVHAEGFRQAIRGPQHRARPRHHHQFRLLDHPHRFMPLRQVRQLIRTRQQKETRAPDGGASVSASVSEV